MIFTHDVSVVIPVYNGERFICEAINSVFDQAGYSIQVIVVDNQSTDGTKETVAEAYGNAVILTSEEKQGCGAARNTGVRHATGKYLGFLDADDVWLPGKLDLQLEALDAQPEQSLVAFGYCREFHDPLMTEEQRQQFPRREEPYAFVAGSTCLLARGIFDRVGDFPEQFGEFIGWFGCAKSLGVNDIVVPETVVRRRIHPNNSSRGQRLRADYLKATKWLLDRRRQFQQSSCT